MPLHEEDEARSHFARMESAYSALLNSLDPGDYRSVSGDLKQPLGELFFNAYMDLHPREELADVDAVEFLGGFFLLDSQGVHSPEAASRIVGAIGVSQEMPSLKELLTRLREKSRTGQSTDSIVKLIRDALWAAEDTASPKRRQALYESIYAALDVQSRGLTQVFDEIVARSNYYSSLDSRSLAFLRDLSLLIRTSVGPEHSVAKHAYPRRSQFAPGDFWASHRELICIADKGLPESQKLSLVKALGRFYAPAAKELVKRLSSPTDQLLDLVEKYVCPMVDSGMGRPRNHQAQRRMRLRTKNKHLYDIGHFLPHSAGGPKDINFFVQERSLNRGWSEQGKRYRWLENMVFANPGTFFFVRPVYGDLSPIPRYLEWGALLDEVLFSKVEGDVERMPDLHLVSPGGNGSSLPQLSWLVSVFENFKADAIRDLMASAEIPLRPSTSPD